MNICVCGCGQEIPWQKHHKYRLPKYIKGHHVNGDNYLKGREKLVIKPPPDFNPTGFCECGCGQPTPIAKSSRPKWHQYKGYPVRYIHGHHTRGKRAHCWQGGRHQNIDGYWLVFMPGHRLSLKNGYVAEHRLIWEEHNGRHLLPGEHVHHIDGDPSNNAPENLIALAKVEHHKLHNSNIEEKSYRSLINKERYKDPEERLKTSLAIKKWWAERKATKGEHNDR